MPIFEDQTPEAIAGRILERLESQLQTREGSYTRDLVLPVAWELHRMYLAFDEAVARFYVDETSGPYLEAAAAARGIVRREGTRATAAVTLNGDEGITVPAGTEFATAGGLTFTLDRDVVLTGGTGEGTLTAADVGDAYNVGAEEITELPAAVPGLTGWTNRAAQGGSDPESDAALFARYDYLRKNPSAGGNEADYYDWALECDGVGDARVQPLWSGPGTVRVLLIGPDHKGVDEAITGAVKAHIEGKRPVGADVTVQSATETRIAVAATLVLRPGATAEGVKEAFVSELDTYLAQTAFSDGTVYLHQVGKLLAGTDGVLDYTGLTLNGGEDNVSIEDEAVPVRGEVTLS